MTLATITGRVTMQASLGSNGVTGVIPLSPRNEAGEIVDRDSSGAFSAGDFYVGQSSEGRLTGFQVNIPATGSSTPRNFAVFQDTQTSSTFYIPYTADNPLTRDEVQAAIPRNSSITTPLVHADAVNGCFATGTRIETDRGEARWGATGRTGTSM